MKRVFVSYSRRNRNFAERLARDLSDAGLDVWIDFRQIHGGEVWRDEIRRGIERSEMMIVCLSPEAVKSEWVQFEVNSARNLGKLVIPVMVTSAQAELRSTPALSWLDDVQFISFDGRYEEAFPQLLTALPGTRAVSPFDEIAPENIPNPFKGLEAFQQTDARFFFGREALVRKAVNNLREDVNIRFLAVMGASGGGKSSLVRAGIIPVLRTGAIPGSEAWRVLIFTPGSNPINALATRLAPLVSPMAGQEGDSDTLESSLRASDRSLHDISEQILANAPANARLLLVIDQFEEAFARASEAQRDPFIKLIHVAATYPEGRTQLLITMRADFFDRISRYPELAELFEQENILIVTEMTVANLLRTIEGPAQAVGLVYEDGLAQRILDDVRRQPGSLPLLQYALKILYEKRDGRRLTHAAYDAIGGVDRALARHAEEIYSGLQPSQQDIMQRLMLRLVEVGESGDATRRRVDRQDLNFENVSTEAVQEVIDLLTAPESRLLIASREIRTSGDASEAPITWIEVSHEALIREWDQLKGWIAENAEGLRYGSELLKAASDWNAANRDSAYLLTGTRLVRAEEWLLDADANALQRAFIQASVEQRSRVEATEREQAERELALQRRAAERLRAFVLVLLISLVVAIGLIFFALNERTRAETNAQIAEENAERAEANAAQASSFALSANADRALADNNGDLALGLAVEALRVVDPVPPQARLTMADVSFAPGTRRLMTAHTQTINAVAYSPAGRLALSAADDGLILVWNTDSGETITQMRDEGNGNINAITVRKDGTQALTGSDTGVITLWDLTTYQVIGRMSEKHGQSINAVAFAPSPPDGLPQTALSAATNNTLVLWDMMTLTPLRRLSGHTGTVNDVAYLPTDANIAASVGNDRRIIFWNLATGSPIQSISTPDDVSASTIDLSPDGALLAIGQSSRGLLNVWTVVQPSSQMVAESRAVVGEPRQYLGHSAEVGNRIRDVSFSPDGTRLTSGSSDGQILFWEALTGRLLRTFNGHTDEIRSLSFNPDGTRLMSGSGDNTLRLWDVQSSAIVRDYVGHAKGIVQGMFMPNGRVVLSGGADTTLRLWDAATGRTIQELRGHTERILSMDVTDDGRYIISSADDDKIRVWDVATGNSVETEPQDEPLREVRLLPGDQQFFGVGRDGMALWDFATLTLSKSFTDPDSLLSDLYAVDVSDDGTLVATGGNDALVRVWNVASGELLARLEGHEFSIRDLDFDPTGDRIVSGGLRGEVMVWDWDAPNPLMRALNGHTQTINGVGFSPDGSTILSGSLDFTIRVWDIETGFEVRRYELDAVTLQSVQSVVFNPDGELILSGQIDGTLRLWRLYPNIDSLLAWTLHNRYVPPLTCDQREQFRLDPLCDEAGNLPVGALNALDVGLPTALPETVLILETGTEARINTSSDDRQRLRRIPGVVSDEDVIGLLDDNTTVILLEGPVIASVSVTDYIPVNWWRVHVDDGREGWVAESDPDENLQSLVPVSAFSE